MGKPGSQGGNSLPDLPGPGLCSALVLTKRDEVLLPVTQHEQERRTATGYLLEGSTGFLWRGDGPSVDLQDDVTSDHARPLCRAACLDVGHENAFGVGTSSRPLRMTYSSAINPSMMAARVAGVPSPLASMAARSSSSSTSLPAPSMAESSVASV